jgi:hypothetical protein
MFPVFVIPELKRKYYHLQAKTMKEFLQSAFRMHVISRGHEFLLPIIDIG